MYVDLAGLARYKRDFDAWARGALLPKDAAAARVRTAKAGAVSFVPVQETPLDVSVDFLFAETPPASGDKSPSNPSTITGVSSVNVVRCNKNIFFGDITQPSHGNVTLTKHNDGSVTVSGVNENASFLDLMPRNTLKLGLAYTLSGCPSGGGNSTYVLRFGDDYYSYDSGSGKTITIGATGDVDTSTVMLKLAAGCDATNVVFYPQVELGTEKTSFEKGEGDTYTISLGNTYYGGSIDLATGVMTVTRQGYVYSSLDGISTNWGASTNVFSILNRAVSKGLGLSNDVCSHFITDPIWSGDYIHYYEGSTSSYFFNPSWTSKQDAVDFFAAEALAGRPVTVSYELAEPYTVQLSPTEILSLTQPSVYDPRVNTVYSDQQAVQVGYLKHPSAASADLRGALVSLGGGV